MGLRSQLEAYGGPISCEAATSTAGELTCRSDPGYVFTASGVDVDPGVNTPIDLYFVSDAVVPVGEGLVEVRDDPWEEDSRSHVVQIRSLAGKRDALLAQLALERRMTCRLVAPDSDWLTCRSEPGHLIGYGMPVAAPHPGANWVAVAAIALVAAASCIGILVWHRRQQRLGQLAESLSRSVAQALGHLPGA